MKKIRISSAKSVFSSFFWSLVFFFPLFSASAETTLFSDLYSEISTNAPETTSARLSSRFGISADQISDFVENGNLISEICLPADRPKGDVFEKSDERMCRQYLTEIWQRESDFTRTQSFEFRRALASTRFWDGVLSSKTDFDVMTDLDILDKQFFGSESLFVDVPKTSATRRNTFFDAKIPFLSGTSSSGGCGSGKTSLYGGISCSSSFCSDYLCVDVKIIPGRRAVSSPGKTLESSIQVIVRELDALAKQQKDMGGNVYDQRNTAKANWFSQIFNWMGDLRGNIVIEKRTPPFLAELVSPDERTKTRKTYEYQKDESGNWTIQETSAADAKTTEPSAEEKANTEKQEAAWNEVAGEEKDGEKKLSEEMKGELQDRSAEIKKNLISIRGQYFQNCADTDCSSEDILKELIQDPCVSQLLRTGTFEYEKGIEMCIQNEEITRPASESQTRTAATEDIKKIFSEGTEGNPGLTPQFNALWSEIDAFEKQWLELGNKYLENATSACGTERF